MTLTPEKLSQIQTSATNRRIREIISAVNSGTLVPRPDFQRKLVWTNRDRLRFLDTVLRHLPFPEIYVCAGEVNIKTAHGTEWLVDGQQRVSTLVSYFNGDPSLRMSDEIPTYDALKKSQKERFLEYVVVVRDLGKLGLDDVREIFERINSTHYGLNAMELANARYDGAIKQFLQKLSEHEFFGGHGVFTASDIRRMLDASFCLSLVISMQSGYFDDTKEHEGYLEKYNDDFPAEQELGGRVEKVIRFTEELCLPGDARWWKKADLFTLMVELDDALNRKNLKPNPAKFKTMLLRLEEDIRKAAEHDPTLTKDEARLKLVSNYAYAAAQGSNHRKSRRTRGEIVGGLIVQACAVPKVVLKLKKRSAS
jgi:hypothetical protein